MKYISFTFDDGREDNYTVAYPILSKYNFPATIFCTTGYIDKTWPKKEDWYSAGEPITIEQLKQLDKSGWEIALHGDKHITDKNDAIIAIEKMKSWGFTRESYGFSLPDSINDKHKLAEFKAELLNKQIAYIRKGRKIDTKAISAKILYGLYNYLKVQFAYNGFNKSSVYYISELDYENVYSVVVRFKDDPQMIANFIDSLPDKSCVVFMLHSILPIVDKLYGKDPWNWKDKRLDKLCQLIAKNQNIDVLTLADMVKKSKEI